MKSTMITLLIIILIFFLAIVIGGYLVYSTVKKKTRELSRMAFGTESIAEGLRRQEELLAATPKSVSGMTKIYLPQIMKDFPEFSLPEFMHKSENQLKAVLTAVEAQDLHMLSDVSKDLREQVRVWIEDDRQRGVREYFQNIQIHQTEISRYQKDAGSCVITLQTAVGYQYYQTGSDKKSEIPKQKQTKYNLYLMYIQDDSLIPGTVSAATVVCPQCGAPITSIGHKTCEYCGAAVEPINIRSWALTKMKEL